MAKSYLHNSALPRGLRNNNPGNIIISANSWLGKVPVAENTDGHFEQFHELYYGLRALAKLLCNKVDKGANTIRKVLTSYAPQFENDTAGYIQYVSAHSGTGPDEPIKLNTATLAALMQAICEVENGKQFADDFLSPDDYTESISLLPEAIIQQIGYEAKKNAPLIGFFLFCWQFCWL